MVVEKVKNINIKLYDFRHRLYIALDLRKAQGVIQEIIAQYR